MLFNSYSFIFVFLPIVFAGMFLLGRHSHRLATLWLSMASVAFYAVWDARFVLLLLGSVAFNYGAGYWIGLRRKLGTSKHALALAIAANLALLCYFKYANFFIGTANQLFGNHTAALNIILPLGISFFTFTQIAFLVDVHRGFAREYNFIHYLLFVTYFPHLIAGPVLHHKQMMPQFANPATYRINPEHVAVGLTLFALGLAKKVMLADNLAEYATPVFNAARDGHVLMLLEAWIGALAYTLQLYFDFSGYSDMALGLSLMFNVRLPVNFDSPYKATSIIDFWRRWHMTLSAFLRDYLYYPLGGNRKGVVRRYANLMATMLLGGLWHGAGWTFVAWGGLHGFYLMVNHGWREWKARRGWNQSGAIAKLAGGVLTFFAVSIAWVIFRADNWAAAKLMLSSMAGLNGISMPLAAANHLSAISHNLPFLHMSFSGISPLTGIDNISAFSSITLGLALVWLAPNARQLLLTYKPAWEDIAGIKTPAPQPAGWLRLELSLPTAFAGGIFFFVLLLALSASRVSEFLYFQF